MGVGILQPAAGQRVPGTVTILDQEHEAHPTTSSPTAITNLKYSRDGRFVLVPQPSNDPNDPLNWPLWRRDLILCALSVIAVVATTLSPIIAANSFSLITVFYVSFTKIALLTGYHLLGVGVAGIFFVPSARVWGKRHLYLLGTVLVCLTSVWGGHAVGRGDYMSFLWARIFQGVALAPFEALVNASVGDLFFVHERGKRMALATVALFGSAFFAPVIVGVIATDEGFQWPFYWVAILSGALFPIVFFCVPETAFVRSASLNTDFGGPETKGEKHVHSGQTVHEADAPHSSTSPPDSSSDKEPQASTSTSMESTQPSTIKKNTYLSTLAPFSGRKTQESYWKLFLRPFPLFLQPGVVWACLTQGVMIGWTVLIGIILAAIYTVEDSFNVKQVGYLFSGAFIGSIAGFLIAGALAQPIANALTKANNGVYEPEMRVPLVALQLVFAGIGLYGFGWTTNDLPKYGAIVPDVFFGFVLAGMVCGAVASALYLVDAHREIAIESFTCMMMFKNIFSFALTVHGYDWIQENGPKRIFIIIGSVQVVISCSAALMYVFGKRNRAFWAKHDILALFGLR